MKKKMKKKKNDRRTSLFLLFFVVHNALGTQMLQVGAVKKKKKIFGFHKASIIN